MSRSSVRAPHRSVRSRPSQPLDCLTRLEQRPRLETGLEQDHLVQVGRLLHAAEWSGFFDGRCGDQRGVRGARRELLAARPEVGRPVAQIAAQRDVNPLAERRGSGLDGKVTRDPLEVRRQLTKLANGPLQLGLSRGGLAGPLGQGVGVDPALGGAGGYLLDLSGQSVDRVALLGGGGGDRLGVPAGLAGGADDGIESLGGVRR